MLMLVCPAILWTYNVFKTTPLLFLQYLFLFVHKFQQFLIVIRVTKFVTILNILYFMTRLFYERF